VSWRKVKLDDVADFSLGKMLDQKKNKGDPLPYLANLNVRWGKFDLRDLREMRFQSHELDRYGLKYGDIVMCEGGEPGRCAIWRDQSPGMMIQKALHRIRTRKGLDNKFLFYSFLHIGKSGAFAPLFTGSTIKHLPRQNLAKVEIKMPSISTQRNIAFVLSSYDDLIENNRQRIALLEDAARQLYKEWFVRFRFPGHEHVKIVDGVPEGWKQTTLGNIALIKKGRNITRATVQPGNIPVVAGGLQPAYFHNKSNVIGPVVTVSASGANAGFVSLYQTDIWASDCSYLSASDNKNIWFLYLFLKDRQVEISGMQQGTAQPHVYPKHLERIYLASAPSSLQHQFTEIVTDRFQLIANLKKKNIALTQARDLLLPKLMSGEIAA
jgi:type I restriction enzyme, S subunit